MRSLIVLCLFFALPLFSQRGGNHSGTYKGEVATSSGKVENTLVLKQDANGKVTGTMVMSDDPAQCVGYRKCKETKAE